MTSYILGYALFCWREGGRVHLIDCRGAVSSHMMISPHTSVVRLREGSVRVHSLFGCLCEFLAHAAHVSLDLLGLQSPLASSVGWKKWRERVQQPLTAKPRRRHQTKTVKRQTYRTKGNLVRILAFSADRTRGYVTSDVRANDVLHSAMTASCRPGVGGDHGRTRRPLRISPPQQGPTSMGDRRRSPHPIRSRDG